VAHVKPLTRFNPRKLPTYSLVVPDRCNDMHDCPVATGDAWLKAFVTPLLSVPKTVVFVIFDEGAGSGNDVAASSKATRSIVRVVGSMVVSHNCCGFISPRPL